MVRQWAVPTVEDHRQPVALDPVGVVEAGEVATDSHASRKGMGATLLCYVAPDEGEP